MKLLLSLTLLVVFERCLSQGLECADCTKASSVDECRLTTVICAANERCFLEKVTTTTLGVAYNGGCRSKTVCDLMASLAGGTPGKRNVEELDPMTGEPLQRGQRDLLNCADCCEDAPDKKFGPCNLQLCGQKPSASAEACLVCPGVHPSSSSCKTKDTCQETQVCYTGIVYVNGLVRYQFGCEEKHLCAALVTNEKVNATTFRRDSVGLQLCDACCTGDQCNKADCFDLKKNMTLASIGITTGPQNTTPLKTQPPIPSTPNPTTSQPVTPKPTTQLPTTPPAQPSTIQPSTPQPSTPKPSTSQPSTPQPPTKQSSTQASLPQTSLATLLVTGVSLLPNPSSTPVSGRR